MFSGIRTFIFGAYEEDGNLSTVQPNLTAAQLLPSLEDQQREEEERILREKQTSAHGDALEESQQQSSDLASNGDDNWELIDFDVEESRQQNFSHELASQKETLHQSVNIIEIGKKTSTNVGKSKHVAAEPNENQARAYKKSGNGGISLKTKIHSKTTEQKEIGRTSGLKTTSTKRSISSTVTSQKVSLIPHEKVETKNIVSTVTVRPTLSFAAIAAKNSAAVSLAPLKSQSSVAPLISKVELINSSPISTTKVEQSSTAGLKRQRPISSSSWSSQSDLNEQMIADSDDDKSMESSDFSDCDYDHGYSHNHFMKGLKSKQSNKHKGQRAHASKISAGEKIANLEDCDKDDAYQRKSQQQHLSKFARKNLDKNIHGRSTRSKKKKLINESMFSPKVSVLDTVQEPSSDVGKLATGSKNRSCMGPPPPPPPPPTTNNSSGNDSSDAAEMDESWFVTPPSCFDGCKSPMKVLRNNLQRQTTLSHVTKAENTKRQNQKLPKAGNDSIDSPKNLSSESIDSNHRSSSSTELENLLIEHPSMYISRPTKGKKQLDQGISEDTIIDLSSSFIDTPVEKNSDRDDTLESMDEAKAMNMERVVTPAEEKHSGSTKMNRPSSNIVRVKAGNSCLGNTKKTRQKLALSALSKKASMQSSVTLLSSRPLSPSSGASSPSSPASSPSPFSSDNEDNLDNTDQSLKADKAKSFIPAHPGLATPEDQSNESKVRQPQVKSETPDVVKINNENRTAPMQLIQEQPPYWQRKKKRCSQSRKQKMGSKNCSPCSGKLGSSSSASDKVGESSNSSLRSTGLINRIGSTIVANITSLTTAIPNVQNVHVIAEEMRKLAESVDNGLGRSPMEQKLIAQRKLAKSTMAKQNKRVLSDKGNRRSGRRTKMFTHANGYSVDRKVQKNFH